ncbi:MAG TPA: hypothetical protein DIW62_17880 [Raoultella sp.]|nr:hypothetical protein [Raoultella sp.]
MTARIYVDQNVVATRYLDTYPYPNDITLLPSLIPGLIIQADWDVNDPASLTRNRVGAAMSVVGSPVLGDYGVTVSEGNYIDSGIDISAYNTNDLTEISILDWPGAVRAVVGRVQINAPQRSRGIQTSTASWISKWLTQTGTAQQATVANSAPTGNSEMVVGRFVRDNGSGSMLTKMKIPRTAQETTTTAASVPYSMQSSNILLGASVDAATTGSVFMRAALVASRALTDAEIATIYSYYKNYYQLKGKTI